MLTFQFKLSRAKAVSAWHKWFAARPDPSDAAGLALYYHCHHRGNVPGFKREAKHTKLISLLKSEDDIFAGFSKNTKHKIKRALNEGMTFGIEGDPAVMERAFNEFAAAKNLPLMDAKVLRTYWPKMICTKLTHEGELLVIHAYLHDPEVKRACEQYSASLFRSTDDPQRQNMIGRANRLLHYLDMLYLKERGVEAYDLGGYALNTTDPDLMEINEFKDGFGGQLVEE
ncbi:MAG: hypothetical protein HY300_02775, partial [Verrucomicrobia bacterium]|nr:hypothetical protein [Verrucomicrobiota bacterium]